MKALLLATILAGAFALGAGAEEITMPRDDMLKALKDRYAEAPVAMGLANNGGVFEVVTSHDGSTWSIILTMPDGNSTLMGSGESWVVLTKLPGQKL